jgi:hypothetical protein
MEEIMEIEECGLTDLEAAVSEKESVELREAICNLKETLKGLHKKLLKEFSRDGVDLQAFYQKNFKDDKLIDNVLPLYAHMHSVAYQRNQNEVTFAQKVTARGEL